MYIYKRDLYLYKNVYRSISQSTMYFKAEIKVIIKSNGEMEVFFPRHSTQTQHQYVISLSSSGYSESSSLLYVDINVELSRQNNVCLSCYQKSQLAVTQTLVVTHRLVFDLASGVNCLCGVDRLLICSGDDRDHHTGGEVVMRRA